MNLRQRSLLFHQQQSHASAHDVLYHVKMEKISKDSCKVNPNRARNVPCYDRERFIPPLSISSLIFCANFHPILNFFASFRTETSAPPSAPPSTAILRAE
mmetsp:Transcript_25703/g.37962  ORF Transcript_25703/g.37962 Transcript_25703/m.37962 type:complete len:100 (-) Transcript_25703:80-379(-)